MASKKPYAVISKSRSKLRPFKVSYYKENNEMISSSQLLTTKWNCIKNIIAHLNSIEIFGASGNCTHRIFVVDNSGKRVSSEYVWNDGRRDRADI